MELALLLPLLLVLFIGIIDFGRVFYNAMTISHAARAGVQYGAQDNIRSGDFAGMRQAAQGAAADVAGVTVLPVRRWHGLLHELRRRQRWLQHRLGLSQRLPHRCAASLRPRHGGQGLHDALPLSGAPEHGRPQSTSDHAGAVEWRRVWKEETTHRAKR